DGVDGKSAFDIWKEVTNNPTATEQEYLAGLKGDKGADGVAGVTTAGKGIILSGEGTADKPYLISADPIEPWQVQGGVDKAEVNTQHIYQDGNVAIGKQQGVNGVTLDVQGSIRGGVRPDSEVVGANSFAVGEGTIASGTNSSAFGKNTLAASDNTFVIGNGSQVLKPGSFALGIQNVVNAQKSFALGAQSSIGDKSESSFALGIENKIVDGARLSYVLGRENTIRKVGGMALGANNEITGYYGLALGQSNIVDFHSYVLGEFNKSPSSENYIIGTNNTAEGSNSTIIGKRNTSLNHNSSILGQWNISGSFGETVLGIANAVTNGSVSDNQQNPKSTIFQLGIGRTKNVPSEGVVIDYRKNAITVLRDGFTGIGIDGVEESAKPTQMLDIGKGNVRVRDLVTSSGKITDKIVVADSEGVLKTVTSTMPKVFYMPPVMFDTVSIEPNTVLTRNLYDEYKAIFGGTFTGTTEASIMVKSNIQASIPTYNVDELDFFIPYYDPEIFEIISLSETGELKYKVKKVVPYGAFMTIVFVVK
ncbi:hypothetical protein ACKLNQ_18150, partial [Myroides odoratimimus]